MNKRLAVSFVFLCWSVFYCKAQMLDSISIKQFKQCSFKELKKIYKNEPKAIRSIKVFRRNRILAYTLYGASIALLPANETVGPVWAFALVGGIYLNVKNSKAQLYNQLRTYEKFHPIKKNTIVSDSDLLVKPYHVTSKTPQINDSVFTISLKEFKKLSYDEIKIQFNVNDTTHLIFKLFEQTEKKFDNAILGSICYPLIGVLAYAVGGSPFSNKEEIVVSIVFIPISIIASVVCISSATYNYEYITRENLYYSFKNYFTYHTFDYRTETYIKNNMNKRY